MRRFLSPTTLGLLMAWIASGIAHAGVIRELPITADYCAIFFALTGGRAGDCAEPVGPLGVPRSIEPSATGFPRAAAPLDPDVDAGYFIRFAFGSSDITSVYRDHLTRLSKVINSRELGGLCVHLVGHTDTVGTVPLNERLSTERAATVFAFLQGPGAVDPARLGFSGMGETTPLSDVPGPHPLNRRVEILAREAGDAGCN